MLYSLSKITIRICQFKTIFSLLHMRAMLIMLTTGVLFVNRVVVYWSDHWALCFEGDLKTFLLSRRQMVGQNMKEAEDVSPAGLTQMALDVAYGLQYLSELRYVHRYVISFQTREAVNSSLLKC